MNNSRKKTPAATYIPSQPMPPLEPIRIEPSEAFKEATLNEIKRFEQAHIDAHRVPNHILHRQFLSLV